MKYTFWIRRAHIPMITLLLVVFVAGRESLAQDNQGDLDSLINQVDSTLRKKDSKPAETQPGDATKGHRKRAPSVDGEEGYGGDVLEPPPSTPEPAKPEPALNQAELSQILVVQQQAQEDAMARRTPGLVLGLAWGRMTIDPGVTVFTQDDDSFAADGTAHLGGGVFAASTGVWSTQGWERRALSVSCGIEAGVWSGMVDVARTGVEHEYLSRSWSVVSAIPACDITQMTSRWWGLGGHVALGGVSARQQGEGQLDSATEMFVLYGGGLDVRYFVGPLLSVRLFGDRLISSRGADTSLAAGRVGLAIEIRTAGL